MRPQKPMLTTDVKKIELILKKATSVLEYRHAQVLHLRGSFGKTAKEIAALTQYSQQNVSAIIGDYFKRGLTALTALNNTRQRKWGNMTLEEEQRFIRAHLKKAENGEIIEVSSIKKAYEKEIGKQTSLSVVYNLLHRHGWRKIAPRPYHPKRDPEKADAFKKTSVKSLISHKS